MLIPHYITLYLLLEKENKGVACVRSTLQKSELHQQKFSDMLIDNLFIDPSPICCIPYPYSIKMRTTEYLLLNRLF